MMALFTETTKHISLNQFGTPVLTESRFKTNIIPIGLAHEGGVTESELLSQYKISRAQLHAALSYFYEYRDQVREYEAETERLLEEHGISIQDAIKEMDEAAKLKSAQ